jgi:two-component system KDP operon response regulator KdpE
MIKNNEKSLILIVEDDQEIGRFLQSSLYANGYATKLATTLNNAAQLFDACKPTLVILDLNLPDGDGVTLIQTLRTYSDTPILVLSARQLEQEKVACFNAGADDYLVKPFGIHELLARIQVSLKHARMIFLRDQHYQVENLHIDLARQAVTLDHSPVHLTPIEFKLLFILAAKPGKVFSHRQLLTEVWGAEYVDDTHYLRIHMGRLRARLEKNTASPRFILTEAGIGYRLAAS